MASILTPQDVDRLIERCVTSLPGEPGDTLRLHQESATELLIDELAASLSARVAPDLATLEERLADDLGVETLPPWMTRSRVVLVVRDAAQDPIFQRAMDRLPAGQRYRLYGDWAKLAASLYRDFPDDQIAGKPAVALNLLAGEAKPLRKALGQALSLELEGRERRAWFDGLRSLVARSQPTAPRPQPAPKRLAPTSTAASTAASAKATQMANGKSQNNPAEHPSFNPEAGIRRPSGTPRLGRRTKKAGPARNQVAGQQPVIQQPVIQQPAIQRPIATTSPIKPTLASSNAAASSSAPSNSALPPAPVMPTRFTAKKTTKNAELVRPVMAQEPDTVQQQPETAKAQKAAPAKMKKRGLRAFEANIADQFEARGLAPIAVTAASTAAIVMAERVQKGKAPDFYDVEYEVMARAGEAVAPGAVRTWTLHAFMECMRDDWFREHFHNLPSQARAETVWVWAKAAAEWFDVPAKLREFWVRSLSGGDPVLA
ncbi:MAG: hypothetical protein AAF556_06460, partial [Pseudomonadota bacterium]